jgi:hypothetical protein
MSQQGADYRIAPNVKLARILSRHCSGRRCFAAQTPRPVSLADPWVRGAPLLLKPPAERRSTSQTPILRFARSRQASNDGGLTISFTNAQCEGAGRGIGGSGGPDGDAWIVEQETGVVVGQHAREVKRGRGIGKPADPDLGPRGGRSAPRGGRPRDPLPGGRQI